MSKKYLLLSAIAGVGADGRIHRQSVRCDRDSAGSTQPSDRGSDHWSHGNELDLHRRRLPRAGSGLRGHRLVDRCESARLTKKAKQQPVTGATLKNNFATGTAVLTFPTGFTLSTGHTLTVDYDTFSIPVKARRSAKATPLTRFSAWRPIPCEQTCPRSGWTARRQRQGPSHLATTSASTCSYVTFTTAPAQDKAIAGDYFALPTNLVVHKEKVGLGNASATTLPLAAYPAWVGAGLFAIYTGTTDDYTKATAATGATITVDDVNQVAQVVFNSRPASNTTIWANYIVQPTFRPLKKQVKLCTSSPNIASTSGTSRPIPTTTS